MPALLEEFSQKGSTEQQTIERRMELIGALGGMDDPMAIEAVVSFAVNSLDDALRYSAINQLKSKEYHQFVPTLLDEMKMPIEGSVSFYQSDNQIVSSYLLRSRRARRQDLSSRLPVGTHNRWSEIYCRRDLAIAYTTRSARLHDP